MTPPVKFYQMFSQEVFALFWRGHSITLLESIMKSWGKHKVKVQRRPPLYIAINMILTPPVYFYQTFSWEVYVTFWRGHTINWLKIIMKYLGKHKVKVERGPNLSVYIAIKCNFDPCCEILQNVFPRGLCSFLEMP